MKPELTADALVQLVHRYYPAGLRNDDPQYKASEEGQRLNDLVHAHEQPSPAWKEFILRLHFTRLSNGFLSTPVPDLVPCSANYRLGEAQLIDCLFTWHRW
jgi:hypothetical protein